MKSLLGAAALCVGLCLTGTALAGAEEAVARNAAGARLMAAGNLDAAIAEFRKAIGSDGRYFQARLNLAYAFEKVDRLDEAVDAYREAIEIQPESFFAHNNLGVLYDRKGLYDSAIAEFEAALAIEPGNSSAVTNLETAKKNRTAVQERAGRMQRAEQEARARPNDAAASYNVARSYAFYGQKEAALEWLARARKQGYRDLRYMRVDPAFESMRNDPDFERLAKP
jgi:tetratricopeptide (TPR) repeat protein